MSQGYGLAVLKVTVGAALRGRPSSETQRGNRGAATEGRPYNCLPVAQFILQCEESFADACGKARVRRRVITPMCVVLRVFPQGTLVALVDRERTMLKEE